MRLKSFVRYDLNDRVVPMSLVKMRSIPKVIGNWKEVHNLCCDPNYEEYVSYSKKKAFLLLNHKGEVVGGPVVRSKRPTSGKYMQIPYQLCCDVTPVPPDPCEEPVITVQPEGVEIDLGDPFTLTVEATGTDLTYQWFQFGIEIEGETSPTFSVEVSTPINAGDYTVVVSNDCGEETSEVAIVVINVVP